MKFNLKRAVDNLAKKDLKFLQPLYEAITNSLESGSDNISVELFTEDVISDEIIPHITGFSVTDNGSGFTEKNRDSFLELWSDKKIEFGCKGSGRFTWLSVFNKITIKSEVSSENKYVIIPFNLNFKDEDIEIKDQKFEKNKTVVIFDEVTDRYFDTASKIDNRNLANVDSVVGDIEQNLLLKLFLLKNGDKKFSIKIKLNAQEREISEKTIPNLDYKTFDIYSDITRESYKFELYYHFVENRKNSKKIYYCANNRTVKEEDDDSLDFSCELPNRTSFNMLLCSKYLDDMVNDSRDDFPGMSNKKQANYGCPLLFKDIKPELLKQMHLVLLERFPELETLNKEEEQKAINASPYLTKYIRENSDIVKTAKSLTTKALEIFNKKKTTVQAKFERVLQDKSITTEAFDEAVAELSEIAAAELGEYILYRDSIIKALNEATFEADKKESFIHDIFMPRGNIISTVNHNVDYTMTNLWLLDDKFMTFTNAFSDITIKKIIESIFIDSTVKSDDLGMNNKKPDLAIFYNKEVSRDALVVEFKGANASLGEKEKSIAEISRNCLLLKEKITEIDTIWAYIITSIDDEFEVSLRASGYKKRYTNAKDGKILYFYNDGIAHIYAIDIKAITADAFARNKTFLEILKK